MTHTINVGFIYTNTMKANLKDIRQKKGVKAAAVARAVGVSRQTYARWEADPSRMKVSNAMAVCAYLGVDMDDVDFGDHAFSGADVE